MTLLLRYILKQFILTAIFSLITFIFIFVLVNLIENIDDFIDQNVPVEIVFQYYLAFIPEIIKLVTPVAILFSTLFTTGKFSNTNELTAMKAAGMSLYRYMFPLVAVALLVSGISIYFNGWIVPSANQKMFSISRVHLKRTGENLSRSNLFLQDGKTRIVTIGYFDGNNAMGNRISIQEFSDSNLISIRERYDVQQMGWDNNLKQWVLVNGVKRTFFSEKENIESITRIPFPSLHFKPSDLVKKQERPEEMNYNEMEEFITAQQRSGNDVARWQVDFYSKISYPFASVIVVLFGVPFSFGKRRKGLALQFGISLAICFIYLSFMKISNVFGYNGDLPPLLTAWLANILFFSAGVVNIVKVGK